MVGGQPTHRAPGLSDSMAADTSSARPTNHRPRAATVFVAAFVAGAAAAVGVNRALDVHLAQAKPQVECEPIFVALRALPQGSPVTVWDVALRDLPKAMVPATALRVTDSFEGRILKFPLREGQPLVTGQLLPPETASPAPAAEAPVREELVEEAFIAPVPAAAPVATAPTTTPTSATPTTATPAPRTTPAQTEVATTPARASAEDAGADGAGGAGSQPQGTAPEAPEMEDVTATPTEAGTEPGDPAQPVATAAVAAKTTVADGEPTPASPSPAAAEVDQQAAVPAQPKLPLEPGGDEAADDELDLPARPPVDVSALPSVMAGETAAVATADDARTSPGVRYLVVPERIARQADTSFTTPTAPGMNPLGQEEQVTTPAATATQKPQGRARSAGQQTVTEQAAQQTPGQAAAAQATRPGQSQAKKQGQSRPRQPASTSQGQPRSGQPKSAQAGPGPTTPGSQSAQQQAGDERRSTGPRAWGGMFPNVSAGIEAFGGWRSGRFTAGQSSPAQSAAGSTTR